MYVNSYSVATRGMGWGAKHAYSEFHSMITEKKMNIFGAGVSVSPTRALLAQLACPPLEDLSTSPGVRVNVGVQGVHPRTVGHSRNMPSMPRRTARHHGLCLRAKPAKRQTEASGKIKACGRAVPLHGSREAAIETQPSNGRTVHRPRLPSLPGEAPSAHMRQAPKRLTTE